jgi:hypothetical protein
MLGFFQVLGFVSDINAYKANQRDLNIWVGDAHDKALLSSLSLSV